MQEDHQQRRGRRKFLSVTSERMKMVMNFSGIHEPFIGKTLFDRVQDVLSGRINTGI